ncbi:MAG TPA: hypothetical protein VL335_01410 [Candidatus Paceibacterota bacterium]|jgi:hypothetical protein|nr:hypothetical protein [Candidatus Paceibacterota bacterium]
MTQSIFDKVRALNLPLGKYVVVGGVMEALGIRKNNDVDVVVTKDLFNKLKAASLYKTCDCTECEEIRLKDDKEILKGDGVDIISKYSFRDLYYCPTETLIEKANIIEGLPFVSLDELRKWKSACAREKDLADIKLIDGYLSTHK